jgi:hypothetical protein
MKKHIGNEEFGHKKHTMNESGMVFVFFLFFLGLDRREKFQNKIQAQKQNKKTRPTVLPTPKNCPPRPPPPPGPLGHPKKKPGMLDYI